MANPFGWLKRQRGGEPKQRPAIIVGLGNPGDKYIGTKHNVGFRCIDLVATRAGISLSDRRKQAALGQGNVHGALAVLAKPRTFMNQSGIAVRYLIDRFGTKPERVLVVIDDMDLPLGKMRLRAAGGSGGHNGLNSVNAELGTQEYPRLRIGIGRPAHDAIQHVLARFTKEEEATLKDTLERVADLVEAWAEHGTEYAMNAFN